MKNYFVVEFGKEKNDPKTVIDARVTRYHDLRKALNDIQYSKQQGKNVCLYEGKSILDLS